MASSLVVLKFDTPEGADKGLEVAQMTRFRLLLAAGPGDRRRVKQLQQVLLLQVLRDLQSFVRAFRRVELQYH